MGRTYDDAIRIATTDSAADEFRKTIDLCKQIQRQYSGKAIARKIDSNMIFSNTDAIIQRMNYYLEHASRGWYD